MHPISADFLCAPAVTLCVRPDFGEILVGRAFVNSVTRIAFDDDAAFLAIDHGAITSARNTELVTIVLVPGFGCGGGKPISQPRL